MATTQSELGHDSTISSFAAYWLSVGSTPGGVPANAAWMDSLGTAWCIVVLVHFFRCLLLARLSWALLPTGSSYFFIFYHSIQLSAQAF